MIYSYKCRECGNEHKEEQSMLDDPLSQCPVCKSENFYRVIQKTMGYGFRKHEGQR